MNRWFMIWSERILLGTGCLWIGLVTLITRVRQGFRVLVDTPLVRGHQLLPESWWCSGSPDGVRSIDDRRGRLPRKPDAVHHRVLPLRDGRRRRGQRYQGNTFGSRNRFRFSWESSESMPNATATTRLGTIFFFSWAPNCPILVPIFILWVLQITDTATAGILSALFFFFFWEMSRSYHFVGSHLNIYVHTCILWHRALLRHS